MALARLTSKGQITIPKEVRRHLHLTTGDEVEFVIKENGQVWVRSMTGSAGNLYGLLKRPGQKAQSVEQLEASLLDSLAEEDRRIREGRS